MSRPIQKIHQWLQYVDEIHDWSDDLFILNELTLTY